MFCQGKARFYFVVRVRFGAVRCGWVGCVVIRNDVIRRDELG
jgi:hypothetical protein